MKLALTLALIVAASAFAQTIFTPLTPCRAVDTRGAIAPFGGPSMVPPTSSGPGVFSGGMAF